MRKILLWSISMVMFLLLLCFGIFFFIKKEKLSNQLRENLAISQWTNMFGIDISHYQGRIDWTELNTSQHQIHYIFIRATMGKDGKDIMFQRNWQNAKRHNYIRGAYHYYRPHENSTEQFNNFKETVKLNRGDFIPILDIEEESTYGRDNLRRGVKNWLELAEKEYGVKPMIYTGLHFYQYVLKDHVDGYPLWIAAYSGRHRISHVNWNFHQFTEKVKIKGIPSLVDGNDFNGTPSDLRAMLVP